MAANRNRRVIRDNGVRAPASKMEKEGISFWKGFLAVLLLSPLAGLIAIFIARIVQSGRASRAHR